VIEYIAQKEAEMKWTKTPPNEPGDYYWRKDANSKWRTRSVYDPQFKSGGLYTDAFPITFFHGEWGGKVPAPDTEATIRRTDER
jgi:hypothetical protein